MKGKDLRALLALGVQQLQLLGGVVLRIRRGGALPQPLALRQVRLLRGRVRCLQATEKQ